MLLEPSDLKIFCVIETNSTQFCESTDYYTHTRLFLTIEFHRQTRTLLYAPGLHTAVSIVGPEVSCLGHFPHYLPSPLSVSGSMTMPLTAGWTHSQYQYWGSAWHTHSPPAPGTPPVPLTIPAFHIPNPPNPLIPPTPQHRRRDAYPRALYVSHSQRHLLFMYITMHHLSTWKGREQGLCVIRTYPTASTMRLPLETEKTTKYFYKEVHCYCD